MCGEQGGTTVEKTRNYLRSVILHFDQNIVWPAAIFHLLTYYFKNMYYLGIGISKFGSVVPKPATARTRK